MQNEISRREVLGGLVVGTGSIMAGKVFENINREKTKMPSLAEVAQKLEDKVASKWYKLSSLYIEQNGDGSYDISGSWNFKKEIKISLLRKREIEFRSCDLFQDGYEDEEEDEDEDDVTKEAIKRRKEENRKRQKELEKMSKNFDQLLNLVIEHSKKEIQEVESEIQTLIKELTK